MTIIREDIGVFVAQKLSKLFIFLGILIAFGFATEAKAQNYGFGSYYGNYASSVVGLSPVYYTGYQQAAWGVNQFFGAVQESWTLLEQGKRVENEINIRRNNLENYKSVQRYYNEGIPAFAPIAPDGKPRSPKITWKDVESIR